MTICIAAICEKRSSVVLAADTMLTAGGLAIQFEHPERKMTPLSHTCMALTAGDALAYTELFNQVQASIYVLREPSVVQIVETIKECYQTIRRKQIVERILKPRGFDDFPEFYNAQRVLSNDVVLPIQGQIDSYDYGLQILAAGIDGESAHIYGIENPGTSVCFDSVGWQAIGSGSPHAITTLIARTCHQDLPLHEVLMIVYEAKKTAEKAPGVGANLTDICVMTPKGLIDFPRDKVKDLDALYQQWMQKQPEWKKNIEELLQNLGVQI